MRCLIVVFGLLVLSGCGSHREAAKAAEQARQADAAVARDMVLALAGQLDVDAWRGRVEVWAKLVRQAEESCGVAVQALSPEARPEVGTTEDQALREPERFVAEAQKQVGRAEAENQDNKKWDLAYRVLGNYAAALAGGDLVTTLLTGVGGIGGLGAVVLGAIKTVGALRKRDEAVVEAVRTGDELAEARTDDEVQAVKARAAKRQARAGTKTIIEKALKNKGS